MINYKKSNNNEIIFLKNNNKIMFDSYISRILENNNLLIILIYPETETDNPVSASNIFAYDDLGNRLWTIEAAPKLDPLPTPYTHIFIADEKYLKEHYGDKINERKLIAYNMHGYDYEVDIKTGKIKLVEGQTRPW